MPVRRRLCADDGVSLVEVLIAMVLVAAAVFAVVREITTSEGTTARASAMQLATATANASLEELRSLPYRRLAVAPASEPLSGDGGGADVLARLETTSDGDRTYRVPDGPAEALVDEDADAPLPTFERISTSVGGRPVRLRVFRFVSWRDEECPIADPGALEAALVDLRAGLASARAPLEGVADPADRGLQASEALLGGTLPPDLLAAVRGAADTGLRPLDDLVRPQLAPVRDALAAVDALVDPVSGRLRDTLDLCDMPPEAVPSLADLAAVRAALGAVASAAEPAPPVTAATADALEALLALSPAELAAATGHAAELTGLTTELLGHAAAIGAALDGILDRHGERATLDGLLGEATRSLEALAAFLAEPDHERNSKRIIVAVVVDGPFAPQRAVWASSVVTDPAEGVL